MMISDIFTATMTISMAMMMVIMIVALGESAALKCVAVRTWRTNTAGFRTSQRFNEHNHGVNDIISKNNCSSNTDEENDNNDDNDVIIMMTMMMMVV